MREKHVTHALKDEAVNQDDPRKKDSSEAKHDRVQDAKARGPAQKTSKQKSKAKKDEEEDDDDNGEDLDGFLVNDAEEEDAEVVTIFSYTRLQLVNLKTGFTTD